MSSDHKFLTAPFFVMLMGLPGSGKSTLRGKMLKHRKYSVLSTDDFIEAYAQSVDQTYSDVFKVYAPVAQKLFDSELEFRLSEHENIIHDQTNLSKKKRLSILKKVPDSYFKVCVNVHCDRELLLERIQNRPGKIITPEIIAHMEKTYVAPSKDEGWDEVMYVEGI